MARMTVQSVTLDRMGQVVARMWCYTSASRPRGDWIRTACGYWVTLPLSVEEHDATCPECLAIDAVRERNG